MLTGCSQTGGILASCPAQCRQGQERHEPRTPWAALKFTEQVAGGWESGSETEQVIVLPSTPTFWFKSSYHSTATSYSVFCSCFLFTRKPVDLGLSASSKQTLLGQPPVVSTCVPCLDWRGLGLVSTTQSAGKPSACTTSQLLLGRASPLPTMLTCSSNSSPSCMVTLGF